jgi:hypothetical protein
MKIRRQAWQQDLGGSLFRLLLLPVLLSLAFTARGRDQSFAVALPELEGPVTMGIFAPSGERIRLLHRDAGITEIPSGLNGLIMSWDGRDDAGLEVAPGIYAARGVVHGPLKVSFLPYREWHPVADTPEPLTAALLHINRITVKAAKDQLLERRPLLSIEALLDGENCVLNAEGLPLLTVKPSGHVESLSLTQGQRQGSALLTLNYPGYSESYSISGLDRVVPLEAGNLSIGESLQEGGSAGESIP